MIRLMSRRGRLVLAGGASALAGGALVLAGGVLPAQAASTGWRVSATFSTHGSGTVLAGVAPVSGGDAWATGFTARNSGSAMPQPILKHWTGKHWTAVTLPAKVERQWRDQAPSLMAIGATSTKDVWVINLFGTAYLRLGGKSWTIGHLPGGGSAHLVEPTSIKVISSSNVWVAGSRVSVSGAAGVSSAYAAHYNGHKWTMTTVPEPASETGTITALSTGTAGSVWAVEDTETSTATSPVAGLPVVLQWTATSGWQDAAQQPALAAGDQLSSVVAEPGGAVWFGGSAPNTAKGTTPLAAEWTGTAWTVSTLPAAATSADWGLAEMTADGSGGLWAVEQADNRGTEHLWHLSGSTWSEVTPSFGKHTWLLESLALVPHTHSVWGVGAVRSGSSADGLIGIEGPTPH